MKLNTQERKDGIWLSKEELTNLMETLTKEAREEQDEVKRAFAYGKAVLAKDLLCRIKGPEREKESKPKIFAGVEDGELIFYDNDRQHKIRISSDCLFTGYGYTTPRDCYGPIYMQPEFNDDFEMAF